MVLCSRRVILKDADAEKQMRTSRILLPLRAYGDIASQLLFFHVLGFQNEETSLKRNDRILLWYWDDYSWMYHTKSEWYRDHSISERLLGL